MGTGTSIGMHDVAVSTDASETACAVFITGNNVEVEDDVQWNWLFDSGVESYSGEELMLMGLISSAAISHTSPLAPPAATVYLHPSPGKGYG